MDAQIYGMVSHAAQLYSNLKSSPMRYFRLPRVSSFEAAGKMWVPPLPYYLS